MRAHATLLCAAAIAAAPAAHAAPKLRVACTLPTIEAIVREVGGDRIETFSLAAGDQDPHFVAPTPSLMKRVREADALFEVGMQLELWADEVANGSGNSRIFRAGPGRFSLSAGIHKLEVPSIITRAQGDVHPEGNPHLWLDPVRAKQVADNAAKALAALLPDDAAAFTQRSRDFGRRVDKALFGDELLKLVGSPKLSRLTQDGRLWEFLDGEEIGGKKLSAYAGGWLAKAAPLRGRKAIEYHKVWVYFAGTFGFALTGTIEEKPGIPPGPKHLRELVDASKASGVSLVLVDNFYDPDLPKRVAEEIGAPMVLLPNQVRGEPGIDDYFALIDHILGETVAAVTKGAKR